MEHPNGARAPQTSRKAPGYAAARHAKKLPDVCMSDTSSTGITRTSCSIRAICSSPSGASSMGAFQVLGKPRCFHYTHLSVHCQLKLECRPMLSTYTTILNISSFSLVRHIYRDLSWNTKARTKLEAATTSADSFSYMVFSTQSLHAASVRPF